MASLSNKVSDNVSDKIYLLWKGQTIIGYSSNLEELVKIFDEKLLEIEAMGRVLYGDMFGFKQRVYRSVLPLPFNLCKEASVGWEVRDFEIKAVSLEITCVDKIVTA